MPTVAGAKIAPIAAMTRHFGAALSAVPRARLHPAEDERVATGRAL
jgi:hypothetical protein